MAGSYSDNWRHNGFTLMEVIVAIAILGISFVLVMQLFSGGLQASRSSCDYTRALVHAKDKMEELAMSPASDSGQFEDGFKWESMVEPYEETDVPAFHMLQIKVKVFWDDIRSRPRAVELVSLRVVSNEQNL